MTNKFQFYNHQYSKRLASTFKVLDFPFWYLFAFCFLNFGFFLNHNIRKSNNEFRLW